MRTKHTALLESMLGDDGHPLSIARIEGVSIDRVARRSASPPAIAGHARAVALFDRYTELMVSRSRADAAAALGRLVRSDGLDAEGERLRKACLEVLKLTPPSTVRAEPAQEVDDGEADRLVIADLLEKLGAGTSSAPTEGGTMAKRPSEGGQRGVPLAHVPLGVAERRGILSVEPRTPNMLWAWLTAGLGVEVPRRALVDGHATPFEYLCGAFFEAPLAKDTVVWAARGAGKTYSAAIATALDMMFKPGIEVRLLGGSLEQSRRMHEHLRAIFERPELRPLLEAGKRSAITERRVTLANGSRAEILAPTHTSVRGARPTKLRCDEVELFDPEVWEAAQLVTRSKQCGEHFVQGSVEALSTWHNPGGLMAKLVADPTKRVLRWGVIDALERCGEERSCAECALEGDCAGRAKRPEHEPGGHVRIADAITMKGRASAASWSSEMLCEAPGRSDAVLPEFDVAVHVRALGAAPDGILIGGMDFGFRAPTVVLIAELTGEGVVRVLDERIESGVVIEEHARWIEGHPLVVRRGLAWLGIDPAGHQRSEQTGRSSAAVLRERGLAVRSRRMGIGAGLRLVRERLAPAIGPPTLLIDPRCEGLIHAMRSYHYPKGRPGDENPVKDGPDHAVDALRYMLSAIDGSAGGGVVRYL